MNQTVQSVISALRDLTVTTRNGAVYRAITVRVMINGVRGRHATTDAESQSAMRMTVTADQMTKIQAPKVKSVVNAS